MCGIAGIISLEPNRAVSEQELDCMLNTIKVEDAIESDKHFFFDKKALVGRVFSASKMRATMKTDRPQGNIRVFFVGELYNEEAYDSGSPEDFLLKRYCEYGPSNFAVGLNGSFSAVIVDSKDKSVSLVTDHTSSYPIFTTIYDEKLYFASELKGLLAVPTIPCEPDPFSVMALAYYGFFLGRHTVVKNINQMDYASICRVKDGKVIKKQCWHYSIEPEEDKGTKYYIKDLAPLLHKAVDRRVRTGRGVIALSGGVDSRGILCCMEDPKKTEAFTYTLRTKKTRHKFGDWAIAERIAEYLNMRLSIFNVQPCNFIQDMYESIYDSDGAAGFIFENIWDDLKKITGATYILLGDECMGWATGILSNSQVFDERNRPAIKASGEIRRGGDGLYEIHGNLYVQNPNRIGDLYDWNGAALHNVDVTVHCGLANSDSNNIDVADPNV